MGTYSPVDFRFHNNKIIPYLPITLPRFSRIRLTENLDELTENGLRYYLNSQGFLEVEIDRSEIELR